MSITETLPPPAATTLTTSNTKQTLQQPPRPPPTKFHTIDGILKSHIAEGFDGTILAYPATPNGTSDFEEYSPKDLDRFVDAAVAKYISSGIEPADPSLPEAPVIAVLSPSSLEIVVTIWAMNRMGYGLLFLSTRLAADAYARLMELSNCDRLITSSGFERMGQDIAKIRECKRYPLITRPDFRHVQNPPVFKREGADPLKETNKLGWIIHSSGSTGFPKPIFLTNYQCLANFVKKPGMRAFCVSPLFHSHALMELGGAIYLQKPMFLGNYALPVTTQNLIEGMSVARPDLFNVVPYVLKLMSERPEGLAELRKVKLVLYAGSACPDALGDLLVANGVNLVANYGCTETGFIMSSVRNYDTDKDWDYCRLEYPIAKHVLMDEVSPGVFECVGLDGLPSKGPSNSDNPPNSFRTKDLFTRHPDPAKSNYYKYLARSDDRLTLVNGEKVLPLPIEGRIRQDPLVEQAAVFGAGKSVPGVIIFRSELAANMSDAELLAGIKPSIDDANAAAESFSRIPEEMIIPMPAGTAYPKTDKFTFIRAQMYQVFAAQIEAAYAAFEDTLPTPSENLKTLSVPELENFLLDTFRARLSIPLAATTTDIFAAGVDSLQTARINSIIRKEIDLGSNASKMSSNVVFEKGTVAALARHLYSLRTGEVKQATDDVSLMQSLIEELSVFAPFTPSSSLSETSGKATVLLTGATGSLGAYIAASLLSRPNVGQVYCLVRAKSELDAHLRVLSQISSRGTTLTAAQISRLVCLPSEFANPTLAIPEAHYNHLLTNLTHVIHCAWPVNFTVPLQTFRPALRGLHNLLQLCLNVKRSQPAKFFFCSSVSVGSNTPKDSTNAASIGETLIPDLSHAQGTGYGKSKLVGEHITHRAMVTYQQHGLEARVLRIGQLSGDLAKGKWNETEAVSLMVQSCLAKGVDCLPALDEEVSWLPVDVCGQAISDLAFRVDGGSDCNGKRKREAELVYHTLNPHKIHWTHDFIPALRRTNLLPEFEVLPPQEWLRRLRESDQDPARNPSIKLLSFWEEKYGKAQAAVTNEKETPRTTSSGLTFETSRTVHDAPVVGSVTREVMLEQGQNGYISKLVGSWMKTWTA
ncbi:Linear gramicidin synthase subunit D [Cyphellophora attinorum]|uniref:Linear gramicidin synthase subunit D n=1 Tax=Cyphellophora attinorum TaxID=1664694 RepID=A0A0N1HLC8_9EURO|nr:Linear gramicidin synthase subunit D [Phialophora attinorum]KPI37785.1 Linear gramicidin synthase subunit D [Phialophora attinorum]